MHHVVVEHAWGMEEMPPLRSDWTILGLVKDVLPAWFGPPHAAAFSCAVACADATGFSEQCNRGDCARTICAFTCICVYNHSIHSSPNPRRDLRARNFSGAGLN